MEISRLEAFLEVARRGSLRSAAQTLHLGQPALSARIAALETELGAPVFGRTRRGMVLTEAGRALVPHAERVMEAAAAGREAVRHVAEGDEGQLVIAAASAINASLVPELVARFRRFHPGVHLFVRTGSAERIVGLVTGGGAQIGLLRALREPGLAQTPLYEEEVILAARPDHPFAREGGIEMGRLADATLILFDPASDDFELTQRLLREGGVAPYGVIEVDGVDTARSLVARGLGVAWLPATAVAADIEAERLARVDVAGMAAVRRLIVALERPGATTWEPIRTLQGLLREVATFVPGATAVDRVTDERPMKPSPARTPARP